MGTDILLQSDNATSLPISGAVEHVMRYSAHVKRVLFCVCGNQCLGQCEETTPKHTKKDESFKYCVVDYEYSYEVAVSVAVSLMRE